MKKIDCKIGQWFKLMILMVLPLALSSCSKHLMLSPSGVLSEKTYDVPTFIEEVEISNSFTLFLTKGEKDAINVEADTSILPYLNITFSGNKLICRLKENCGIRGNAVVNIYVTYTDKLDAIDLSGATACYIKDSLAKFVDLDVRASGASNFYGTLVADKLSFDMSGSSSADISIVSKKLEIDISGASNISCKAVVLGDIDAGISGSSEVDINGVSESLKLEISGASSFGSKDFETKNAEINLSGSSRAKAILTGKLNLEASGASVLYYGGTPVLEKINLTGSSRIEKL